MTERDWDLALADEMAPLTDESFYDGALSDAVFRLVALYGSDSRERWESVATSADVPELWAVAGVLGVTTIDRRVRNFGKFVEFMHGPEITRRLGHLPQFQMLLAESLMYESEIGSEYSLDRARALCAAQLPRFARHHGAQNLMVEICLHVLDARDTDVDDVLQQAESANTRSLELSGYEYGKYFAHRGVLRAYRGQRLEGLADVRRAIDLESSERWDYAARIAQYESVAARVETICLRRHLAQEVEKARAEIEGARGQVLTMTGLLAAVVAIVVVNIGNVRTTGTRGEVFTSTLVANGTVILGFGLLISLVLTPRTRTAWVLAVLVPLVGLSLLLIGAFVSI
ncbi:hypothetical protein [Cellulomonas sp. URHD0024]|uniref:hypothetical protein n=1 Tax=Cellulomonas sp. URHD0024 TaxID=1302620 RepID=UPI0012DF2A63|nr:hypothetical protein [Cellulomonas sp. URHD0024]